MIHIKTERVYSVSRLCMLTPLKKKTKRDTVKGGVLISFILKSALQTSAEPRARWKGEVPLLTCWIDEVSKFGRKALMWDKMESSKMKPKVIFKLLQLWLVSVFVLGQGQGHRNGHGQTLRVK